MSKPVRDAVVATGGLCAPAPPLPGLPRDYAADAARIMTDMAANAITENSAKAAAKGVVKLAVALAPDVTQLAMVALYPEPEEAGVISEYGDTEATKLHVTMVFLGDVSKIDMKAAARAVGSASGSTKPMTGKISGAGVFAEGPDGYPQIAIPGVQGLAALRAMLVDRLAAEGIVSPSEHDWMPHMTLAYIDEPELPDMGVVGLPVTFNQLSLVVEDVREDFPLDPQGAADDVHRPDPGEKAAPKFTRAGLRRRDMLITQAKELA